MVPAPAHPQAYSFVEEDWPDVWDTKQSQQNMPGMFFPQQQGVEPWRGELGPNLLPIRAGPDASPITRPQNMHNILPLSPNQGLGSIENEVWMGMEAQQMQHPLQINDGPNQCVEVIALPAGAAPPQGAIPINSLHTVHETPAPKMVQMIAVPLGEAPPEGAIPVDQFPLPVTVQSDSPQKRPNKAFKIKDPRTGKELRTPSDDAAAPRFRITNPKTGEEIRPNL